MASATQLIQQGFNSVATFNHRDRAEFRAGFYRKLGHEATVVVAHNSFGVEFYVVYLKIKEV